MDERRRVEVGVRVKVTGCRDGWTDRFVGQKGEVKGDSVNTPGALVVDLDGDDTPRVFFPDELTPVESLTPSSLMGLTEEEMRLLASVARVLGICGQGHLGAKVEALLTRLQQRGG